MARVVLSNKLIETILTSVRESYKPKLDTAQFGTGLTAEVVYDMVYGAQGKTATELGGTWCNMQMNFEIRYRPPEGGTHSNYVLYYELNAPRAFPQSVTRWDGHIAATELGKPTKAALDDMFSNLLRVREELDASVIELDAIMRKAVTLKRLEELWPSVTQHIPQETLNKLRAVQEVKRSPKALPEMSSSLKSTLVTAQILKS